MGGLARSAKAPSGTAISAPARRKFLDGFYDATDPALPPEERQRQANAALKLHMTRLARKAARARKTAAAATAEALDAVDELLAASDHAV